MPVRLGRMISRLLSGFRSRIVSNNWQSRYCWGRASGTYRHLPPNETLAPTFTLALPALVLTAPTTRAPVLKGPGATLIVPPEPGAAVPSSDTSCALLETETAGPWPRTLFAAAEV